MASRLLVSVGSDGYTNWVRLPNGQKLNLGTISVLSFVSKLGKDARSARQTLNSFLQDGEAVLHVNEEDMWDMLAPKRARWAFGVAGPFMTFDPRTVRKDTMAISTQRLKDLDRHIEALNKAASQGVPAEKMAKGLELLTKLAKAVVFVADDQGEKPWEKDDNKDDDKSEGQQESKGQQSKEATLAFDTYVANTESARATLARAEETIATIDRLVAAGRKFNAAKAKADVHAVTSKVASILQEVDLTTAWVKDDLTKLASRAEQLHKLFATAKV